MSEDLSSLYKLIRQQSVDICSSLETEDYCIQSAPQVSPAKWHLGHMTWFFENFLLNRLDQYSTFNSQFSRIFNSYYKSQGEHWVRSVRGHLSRPTVAETLDFRKHVDQHMLEFMDLGVSADLEKLILTGIHHEQQHQELLLMDIKYNYSVSPIEIKWVETDSMKSDCIELKYIPIESGLYSIGQTDVGFSYCNERPEHKYFLNGFALANRPVSCKEYLQFINDGGYENFQYWSSDGWDDLQSNGRSAPLYWRYSESGWFNFTLRGWQSIDPNQPVSHLSYYEAQAFAHWVGKRLPTEQEWEIASRLVPDVYEGNFFEQKIYSPQVSEAIQQGPFFALAGNLWEWTQSSYSAYPGYQPPQGAMAEYNAKFMCGQYVLRGGSFATSRNYFRKTYRNFYYPRDNWMFSGLRLAEDL